jgi:hypothetical protein
VLNLQPAQFTFAKSDEALNHLVTDTRKPYILDDQLRIIHASNIETGLTIGTLISWANHPETLWSDNLLITSDFPHYVREGVENGIYHNDSIIADGLGGITIYINGAIGGLMTTLPDFGVNDPFSDKKFLEPSFEKARVQGTQVALVALRALNGNTDSLKTGNITLYAKTLDLPLTNSIFRLGASLGILDRGMNGWMRLQTEVAYFKLGPASFITMPGEIYPEIVNGGIEAPGEQDFNIAPVETPPVRNLMPGKYKFVFGMTNDMIGYIIPKSEWDEKAPFIYGEEQSPYGEINSVGYDTAPILYKEVSEMIGSIE